jgi:hypothetical protein
VELTGIAFPTVRTTEAQRFDADLKADTADALI